MSSGCAACARKVFAVKVSMLWWCSGGIAGFLWRLWRSGAVLFRYWHKSLAKESLRKFAVYTLWPSMQALNVSQKLLLLAGLAPGSQIIIGRDAVVQKDSPLKLWFALAGANCFASRGGRQRPLGHRRVGPGAQTGRGRDPERYLEDGPRLVRVDKSGGAGANTEHSKLQVTNVNAGNLAIS